MNERLLYLKDRIEIELRNIEKSVQQSQNAWDYAKLFPGHQEHYFNSVAMNLHSFYNGVERIFEIIARQIDPEFPSGDRWHRKLLDQMAKEIPGKRPAIISSETLSLLDKFLAFRHLVRSLYAFQLEPERLGALMSFLEDALSCIKHDLNFFCQLLDKAIF